MKLITLNTWGGKIKDELRDFIDKYKEEVDIFCFQEIFHEAPEKSKNSFEGVNINLLNDLKSQLTDFDAYFCPFISDVYGIATFIRKNIKVLETGDRLVYKRNDPNAHEANHDRKLHYSIIDTGEKRFCVLNVHGLWNGQGKTDTPDRLLQSQNINEFMNTIDMPKILCGDFNLLPDTQSLKMLRENMRDLVNEYGITTTRTSYYPRAETSGHFADYILTTKDIKLNSFSVLPEEVSDHSALMIDFEI